MPTHEASRELVAVDEVLMPLATVTTVALSPLAEAMDMVTTIIKASMVRADLDCQQVMLVPYQRGQPVFPTADTTVSSPVACTTALNFTKETLSM